jgi:hypothetical protein
MSQIIIQNPVKESLSAELAVLYKTFKDIDAKEENEFDLSGLNWVHPFLLLPMVAYSQENIKTKCFVENEKIKKYLELVKFPYGISSTKDFETKVSKTYIPISILKKEETIEREKLETMFTRMVYKILGSVEGARNAVYYPIGELVGNIFEHSKKDTGYIFGQYYPNKEYLDICIVDCGRGLKQAYLEEKNLNFDNEKAVEEVLSGNSTKPDKERGYGVRTSKRVVCEALGGQFILISGDAALLADKKEQKLVSLPGFNWQGVIIAYKIPKPVGYIDITPYLE